MVSPFLPVNEADVRARGWPGIEVLLVTGDPYIDHASFGVPLLGRYLEACGVRTGIVSQPPWRLAGWPGVMGRPALWCGISGGSVDSVLAGYTVNRKRRREDAYGPGGAGGVRPTRACIAYSSAVRAAFPGLPVVLGGIEAGTRRLAHYDWWDDGIRRSILLDARADLVVWGEGELAALHVTECLRQGRKLWGIPGTAVAVPQRALDDVLRAAADYFRVEGYPEPAAFPPLAPFPAIPRRVVTLPGYEELRDGPPRELLRMTAIVERETRGPVGAILVQRHGDHAVVSFPRARYLDGAQLDAVAELPFSRCQSPGAAAAPALAAIQTSVITHRGCPGGCTFCAIGVHQGRTIRSRSIDSVIREMSRIAASPFFRGTVSDLGGPTANLYGMGCKRPDVEARCSRPSCLWPEFCPNFRMDAGPFLALLAAARDVPAVAHAFVASGIRHDVLLATPEVLPVLVAAHTCGRMKIAPEHASDRILALMRKPPAAQFARFVDAFRAECRRQGKPHELASYFIASFPGSTIEDMRCVETALRSLALTVDQVQDFWPAPLTPAAAMYWAGEDAEGAPLDVAKDHAARAAQKACVRYHARARGAGRDGRRRGR